MDSMLEDLINEMKQAIEKWFEFIGDKDAEQIVKRTPLQVGIHDYGLLEYAKGRVNVSDTELDFVSPKVKTRLGESAELLSEEQVREQIVPRLAVFMQQQLDSLPSPALIDYKFTFWGKFRVQEGEVTLPILQHINEAKKERLLNFIASYIQTKLKDGKHPTKPLETFFLSRHLLDEKLFPDPDAGRIISMFENILELNKGKKERLAEHRSKIVNALRNWAEETFLPRYFEIRKELWNQAEYTRKSDIQLEDTEQGPIELLLYTAVSIIKYEPSYSKSTGLTFLERAVELGSARASRYMKEGSGTFAKEDVYFRNELVECTANDVFATVTIAIKQEAEESYARALRFICRLLQQGFPKSYQIKLKSSVKQFLPIKGLAKSGTHRFFANAMEYPNLHPLLEEYAREAMEEFEWYADTEGEKNCMPGSYAVFGLGLANRSYFALIEDYMKQVDDEHQSVQNDFTAAFVEQYGVNAETIPTLVTCLLHSTDSIKLKIKPAMEEEAHASLLLDTVSGLQSYEAERIVYAIWGGMEKLKTVAAKAKGEKAALLSGLVQAASSKESQR
ncbi:DUF6138 family protein [Paenibacillus tyrfis]|uniref:Uncharacterized protein n=1 Tax=Paenibacillus tyrfis TaxID=1501230 RepID=A0A081NT24_9BACL|nr:DUF6138 family protein [Paenibacillus tyrfis]KEQ21597.1 hypothetical protein ET33_35365 [Paenibacillus tyrfis]